MNYLSNKFFDFINNFIIRNNLMAVKTNNKLVYINNRH